MPCRNNLTEALRGRNPEGDISALVDVMQRDYDMTAGVLQELVVE